MHGATLPLLLHSAGIAQSVAWIGFNLYVAVQSVTAGASCWLTSPSRPSKLTRYLGDPNCIGRIRCVTEINIIVQLLTASCKVNKHTRVFFKWSNYSRVWNSRIIRYVLIDCAPLCVCMERTADKKTIILLTLFYLHLPHSTDIPSCYAAAASFFFPFGKLYVSISLSAPCSRRNSSVDDPQIQNPIEILLFHFQFH